MKGNSLHNLGKTVTALSAVAMGLGTPPANANPHTARHPIPAAQLDARWTDHTRDTIHVIDIGQSQTLTASAKFYQDYSAQPIVAAALIKGDDTSHFHFSMAAKGPAEIRSTGYGHAMVAAFKQG